MPPTPRQAPSTSRVAEFIDNPRRAVWLLAAPALMGMGFQTLHSLVNMVFVGWLGEDAIAALTFNMPLVFLSIGITFGLGSGATSVIAQYLGAEDKRGADNAAEHALLIGVVMGVVVPAFGLFFDRHIFAVLGAPAHVTDLAVAYFRAIAMGFVFTILNVQFRAILAGEGDNRTANYLQAAGTVLNAVLDPLLMFGAGMGIAGAAWATVISQVLVCLAFLYLMLVRRRTYLELRPADFAFRGSTIGQILRIGLPASASMVIMSLGGMFINRIVAAFGSPAVAALGVGGRLDQIYILPTMALSASMVTLGGMFFGAGRLDLFRSTLRYTLWRGELIAIAMGTIFFVVAPYVMGAFCDDPTVQALAVSYIRVIVLSYPFVTVGMIASRAFQGLGDGMPGLIITALRVIVVSGGLAWALVHVFGQGLTSVWVAMVVAAAFSCVLALTWIHRRLRQVENAAPTAG